MLIVAERHHHALPHPATLAIAFNYLEIPVALDLFRPEKHVASLF
jgi:hypothetical protein